MHLYFKTPVYIRAKKAFATKIEICSGNNSDASEVRNSLTENLRLNTFVLRLIVILID